MKKYIFISRFCMIFIAMFVKIGFPFHMIFAEIKLDYDFFEKVYEKVHILPETV